MAFHKLRESSVLTGSDPTDSSSSDVVSIAVTPVADYEPPARDVRQCRPSPTTLRKRNTHVPQRHSPTPVMSAPMRQAALFADAALRRVLEVIDRRRPSAQLNGLLAAGLVDSVLAANRHLSSRDGVAVLRRIRLQAVDGLAAAEVFGSYRRGQRTHAIACRIEQFAGRWQVVALHIG
jgi:hypothetical protein